MKLDKFTIQAAEPQAATDQEVLERLQQLLTDLEATIHFNILATRVAGDGPLPVDMLERALAAAKGEAVCLFSSSQAWTCSTCPRARFEGEPAACQVLRMDQV
jgi:hypothetical protein